MLIYKVETGLNGSHLDNHHIVTALLRKIVRMEKKSLELHHPLWPDIDSINSHYCLIFNYVIEAFNIYSRADTLNDV